MLPAARPFQHRKGTEVQGLLRIVGVQRRDSPDREFVLLQNQGSMRVQLKGHLVLSESAFEDAHLCEVSHVFADDVHITPGSYVVLYTGYGVPGFRRSKDGSVVYHAYMESEAPIWSRCSLPLHILNKQHSYVERGEPLLLR